MSIARIAHNRRWSSSDALDDLFLEHYAALVGRAQHLVGRNRHLAEDLVHDVYVRLALRQFDLSSVHNVEAYLVMTLRNVHLSHVRRRQSKVSATVSIVDHESAVAGLRSVANEEERQDAYEALRHVVHYACLRKTTSTAASVLILRFFHGYYPREIARVVQATEAAVTERLRMARAEARAYLTAPSQVRNLDARRAPLDCDGSTLDDTVSTLALQRAIFDARTGACPTERALDCLYAASEPLGVATLAHLVSCAECLDIVNHRLGLPLLADRDPSDRIGRGGPPKAPGGRASAPHLTRMLRTRLEDAREDYPQEMQIAVNGLFVSAQAINGHVNEQRLKLLVTEQVGFVEIFDEDDTCLLYLDVELPPAGAVEQSARVPLSGGRVLCATLLFADATPTLHVMYDSRSAASERPAVTERAAPEGARQASNWTLWPLALRFAIAGIIAGVLLANPRQTLAAVQYVRRSIVESVAQLLDRVRPRPVVPSRPATTDVPPLALPAVSEKALALTGLTTGAVVRDLELSEAMLQAFDLLDGVGALMKEQIAVERGARRLHIDGVVESEARRRELTAVLRALPARRVRVDLLTVAEAARHTPTAPAITRSPLRSADITRDREPLAFESVRPHLTMPAAVDLAAPQPKATGDVDEAVRRFAAGLLSRSLQARLHGRTVRQLAAAVIATDAERLSPGARTTWHELVRRHAERLRNETAALRSELEPIFPPPGPNPPASVASPPSGDVWHGDVSQMAERLFALTSMHDVAVREAFTVATNGNESLDVATPTFRRSLLETERLVEALIAAMPGTSSP